MLRNGMRTVGFLESPDLIPEWWIILGIESQRELQKGHEWENRFEKFLWTHNHQFELLRFESGLLVNTESTYQRAHDDCIGIHCSIFSLPISTPAIP